MPHCMARLASILWHVLPPLTQSEALTTRLKHIIEDYADGPGILLELLQNADDAGAREVAFLLDNTHYGTSSVLGGRHRFLSLLALYSAMPCSPHLTAAPACKNALPLGAMTALA